MIDLVRQNLAQIGVLCRKYGIQKLELFGSAASDDFDPANSDIDFFSEFDSNPHSLADRFFGLMEDLEQLLDHKVDLVSIADVRNPYFLKSPTDTGPPCTQLESAKLLGDILEAGDRIGSYVAGKTRESYLSDNQVRDAVNWNFESLAKL